MVFSVQTGKRLNFQPQSDETVTIEVTSGGDPLPRALIFLVTKNREDTDKIHVHNGVADSDGKGQLSYSPADEIPFYISAMSASGTWYGASSKFEGTVRIECPPMAFSGNLGWWHKRVGISEYDASRGQGIRVGLVDSGVGPHPYLEQVKDMGAIIDGEWSPDGQDVSYHGTMMAGLIAARPTDDSHPGGIAPGVDLYALRVFPSGSQGAKRSDVAAAITKLADVADVDLINLSLSSEDPSDVQEEAINDARAKGVLCIAAAGNDTEPPVRYPAMFPGVIAVGASGYQVEPGPTLATNAVFRPEDQAMNGNEGDYLSVISSYGEGLTCLAPGTAIASTVKSKSGKPLYASQLGSSDSVAIVTAVLAARLSTDKEYLAMPRTSARADYAEAMLKSMCVPLGMDVMYEGLGMPRL